MTPDEELMLIFGGLHLVALTMGAVLFLMFLKSDTSEPWDKGDDDSDDDEGGGGGGGNDRTRDRPKPRPSGGIPLPDARQSSVRLRGPDKLRDAHRRQVRRPAHEPVRAPRRTPARH
jgi:hypothetical protein